MRELKIVLNRVAILGESLGNSAQMTLRRGFDSLGAYFRPSLAFTWAVTSVERVELM